MRLVFRAGPGPHTSFEMRGAPLPARLVSQVRDDRARGRRVGRQPRGGRRAGREPAARGGPSRRERARERSSRAARSEVVVYDVQRRGRSRTVAASSCAARTRRCSSGLRTQAGRPLEDAALDRGRAAAAARLEALGHFEARVETEVARRRRHRCRSCSSRGPGRARVVRRGARRGPAAAGRRRTTGGPRSCALRAGRPYRVARRRAEPRDAALRLAPRRATWRCACAATSTFSEARDEARVSLVVEPGPRTIVEHVVLAGLDAPAT